MYTPEYNLWHKEDGLSVEAFTYSVSGQMYGYAGNKVYGFGDADNMAYLEQEVSEEYVKWYAQTGEMGWFWAIVLPARLRQTFIKHLVKIMIMQL